MGRAARALVLSAAGLLLAVSCGGGAAAQSPSTSAPVVATLPPTAVTVAPTVAPTATAVRTATPAPSVAASADSTSLIAKGKVVYLTVGGVGCVSCHGPEAKGGTASDGSTAPNIQTATEQKLRDALRGGAALMTNLKLTDADIESVLAYIASLP